MVRRAMDLTMDRVQQRLFISITSAARGLALGTDDDCDDGDDDGDDDGGDDNDDNKLIMN